jgi:8-oxo-dGTP pyrophosphatase MutT (NUDIX family)
MEVALKQVLAQRTKQYITDNSRVSSAVLIPIYKNDGQYHMVFIKRTNRVKTHKGQISFPGGMRDREDKTLEDTALREASEEIGLRPEDAVILGELDDEITTTSNYIVTPFIAAIPYPYTFTRNTVEVAKVLTVPIAVLLDARNRKPETETLNDADVASYAYYYKGTRIWGATARILYKLLAIIESLPRE